MPSASILTGEKTGPQIRNGRANIMERKLKSQLGGGESRVHLNDFRSSGSDEFTPSLLQEIADVISETRWVIFKKLSGDGGRRQKDSC